MAQIAKSGTPSLASLLPNGADVLAGLMAGEALTAFDACYIASTGLVMKSNGTAAGAAAKVHGYAAKTTAINDPVTLYKNVRVRYGTALTPGTSIFVSATAGTLSDTATIGGTAPIGFVIDATRVFLDKSNY